MANIISLPEFFHDRLAKSPEYRTIVDAVLTDFGPWIAQNDLYFFPEYTDHGPRHIQDVLATEDELIPPAAKEPVNLITPKDVMMLVVATILHDSAMHLTGDGFQALLLRTERVSGFDDRPWSELWRDYLFEARHWDEKVRRQVLGNESESKLHKKLTTRSPNFDDLPKVDRLLVGEFIRRHHARIAHEIAIFGLSRPPGYGGSQITIPRLEQDDRNLCGLIARSHGISLRTAIGAFRKLNTDRNPRERRGVHAPFLMALLRVADILQIQSERAPKAVLATHRLVSPISNREWRVHQCIQEIRGADDPEAVWFEAEPPDIHSYLRVKEWLSWMQAEIDASWTALGEIYARYTKEGYHRFGLALRRVLSNLDDEKQFAEDCPYIPRATRFHVSDAGVLKVLVRPLYDNSPYMGVRELMQNAIDAVRTARDTLARNPALSSKEFADQDADIVVDVQKDDRGCRLVISDKGIGMTADEVINYFLKAGASIRNDDGWRREHEDSKGNLRVLRTGKFGIGALAAFVLGNKITVSTRKLGCPVSEGITFVATLEADTIQLNRCERPAGTIITVDISEGVYDDLAKNQNYWDWYHMNFPAVVRNVNSKPINKIRNIRIPELHEPPGQSWREISYPGLQRVLWSPYQDREFYINGIVVGKQSNVFLDLPRIPISGYYLDCPILAVADSAGILDVNASRTTIYDMPFYNALVTSINEDLLSHILLYASFSPYCDIQSVFEYPLNRYRRAGSPVFVFSEDGIVPLESSCLEACGVRWIIGVRLSDSANNVLKESPDACSKMKSLMGGGAAIVFSTTYIPDNASRFQGTRHERQKQVVIVRDGDTRVYEFFAQICGDSLPARIVRVDGWSAWKSTVVDQELEAFAEMVIWQVASLKDEFKLDFVVIYRRPSDAFGSKRDDNLTISSGLFDPSRPFMKAWNEILGVPYLPYDQDKRRRMLPHAYARLAPYIEKYEAYARK